jgi:hypothetical protein
MGAALCPPLQEARRRNFEDHGGSWGGGDPCPGPPYLTALVAAPDGIVRTIVVSLGEVDGRAGGSYAVSLPVTERLRGLVRPQFRDAFGVSSARVIAYNSNVPDPECEGVTATF